MTSIYKTQATRTAKYGWSFPPEYFFFLIGEAETSY